MKNKKILIIGIIVIVLIIAATLGVLYFTTDLFKTEQQLFYKYIAQTKVMNSDFITQYNVANNRITKNSNSSHANLDVSMSMQNQETGIADIQKIFSIKSNGLENALSNQSYRDFTLSSGEQNFLTLKYMRDGNTYAIGADNILAKYLAVENANLKNLFTKLGVQDVSQIPDSIKSTNYDDILKIDEETLDKLKETYGTLIYNNVSAENFFKVVNSDKTETIGVSLTDKELINLVKVTLETIKSDTTLLNLIINKAQVLNYNELNIVDMQLKIQELIDDISIEELTEEQEILKISLVKKEKNVTKLIIDIYEINEKNRTNETINTYDVQPINPIKEVIKNTFEFDFANPNKIVIFLKENDIELSKTTIDYLYNNNITFNIESEVKDEQETSYIKIQYQINNYQTDNIIENLAVNIGMDSKENLQINLVNNTTLKQDVQISKLTTDNSAKLNDMTSEELNQLFVALGNRINQLYGNSLNNSIIENAQSAREQYEKAQEEENTILQNYQNMNNQIKNQIEN